MTVINSWRAEFERVGFMKVSGVFAPQLAAPIPLYLEDHLPSMDPSKGLPVGEYPMKPELFNQLLPIIDGIKKTGLIQNLIGSETLYLRLPPTVRRISPQRAEMMAPPHQDGAFLDNEMAYFVTAWVPLVEIDGECQGLGLYPSLGHDRPFNHQSVTAAGRKFTSEAVGHKAVTYSMVPGDILIFHRYMAHASLPNISERIRYSFDMRFFGSLERTPTQYLDLQTWTVVTPDPKHNYPPIKLGYS